MEHPVRYLESFDSIRAGWRPGPDLASEEARAQACIETMVSLAFGYDIVIQRSFALDSLAFQYVLRDFRAAFRSVTAEKKAQEFWKGRKLPVRLHLYGHKTFRESASSVFEGIGKGTFYSHLYPELLGQEEAKQIGRDLKDGRIFRVMESVGGDDRAELFESLWDWFGQASIGNDIQVFSPDPQLHIDLQSLLEPILSDESTLFQGQAGAELREDQTLSKLITALRTLQKEAGEQRPFASRSPLYTDQPWAGNGGPSAKEIVQEALPLVQEVANTLYNLTTVASIGSISALYSTPMSGPDLAAERLVAQSLALDSAAIAKGARPRPRHLPGHYVGGPALPSMEVGVQSENGVAGEFNKKLGPASGHTVAAFEGLLELRREEAWKSSIQGINEAYFGTDFQAYRQAVLSHLKVVQEHMGRSLLVRINADELGFTMEAPTQLGELAGAGIESSFGIPAQVTEPLLSATIAYGYPRLGMRLARRSSVESMRTAWTEVVNVPDWPTNA